MWIFCEAHRSGSMGVSSPAFPFTFLHAQLQGGQSYMYKVTLLIFFVTHKIYTTSPSWRPVSLLLPVAVREHR